MSADYRVSRGDELNFRFFYAPELNTVVQVRSDGRIALPLIGEFTVDAMSLADLQRYVQDHLAALVRRPEVVINVQGTSTQRVYVGGEVTRQGVQPMVGPMTALQAVMVAEGLRETAQPRDVIVLRRGPDGMREALKVNLAAVMEGQEGAQDLPLQPFDVVLVPRSGIANVGLWVDQYIRRVLPFSTGLSYTINSGSTVK